MEPIINCPILSQVRRPPNPPQLVTMSFQKLGDFIVATPSLQKVQEIYFEVTVAVPDTLCGLYSKNRIFKKMIPHESIQSFIKKADAPLAVLDLTFPLLEPAKVPRQFWRLPSQIFRRAQHVSHSYTQSLNFYYPELDINFESTPFLDLNPDSKVLKRFHVQPFEYFTIHTGSDYHQKNWPLSRFREIAESLLKKYPHLKCVELVGPQENPIYESPLTPHRHVPVKTALENVAQLLSGSLFHIDNDSGIHHLAGALDVPSITIFGPTPPGSWSSLTKRNFIHWGAPYCLKPCGGAEIETCRDKVCLSHIRAKYLLPTVEKILSHYGMSQPSQA